MIVLPPPSNQRADPNYRGRYICMGCLCLTTPVTKRCVNDTCLYYKPFFKRTGEAT